MPTVSARSESSAWCQSKRKYGAAATKAATLAPSPSTKERIDTLLRPTTLGRSSFRCEFEMRVGERVLADGYAVMVTYDHAAARSMPIPGPLRERLLADGARQR